MSNPAHAPFAPEANLSDVQAKAKRGDIANDQKHIRVKSSIRHPAWLFFRACCALALVLAAHPLHAADLRLDDKFTSTFTWNRPGFAYINSIKEQKDGKIVVGGFYTFANGVARLNIARLNVDGSLDLGFDPGTGVDNVVDALEVLPDNKIVVAGLFASVNGVSRRNLARLNADGSVDSGFTVAADSEVFGMSQGKDGTGNPVLFIGGQFWSVNGVDTPYVARLNASGLDPTFSTGAAIVTGARVWRVAALPGGGVLVGGAFPTFSDQPYRNLVRLGPSGAVDSSFNIGTGADLVVISLAVQPDGKYLVGGAFTTFNGVAHPGIVRLLPSGAVDTSFNAVIAGAYASVSAIGIQDDGRIIIGGGFDSVNGVARKNFARLNPDGSVDLEFDPGTGADLGVRAVAVLAQDHVVLGGQFNTVNALPHGRIARYVADPTSAGPADNPHTLFAGGRDDWRRIGLPRPLINTSGLDLLAEGTLFYMSTLGPPLFARLSYNSFVNTTSSGSFGNHWRFLYESSLTQYGSKQVVLQMGSGGRETFTSTTSLAAATPGTPVTLTSMKGNFSQLKSYGTYFLYTEKDTRFVYRFDASSLGQPAYLTKIADRNGNALTINAALATGRIASIVDSAGRRLALTYDANGRCSVMTTPDGRRIEFTYDASGELVQIKDMAGYLGKYTYTGGYLTRTDLGDLPSSDEGRVTNFAFTNKIWGTGKYVSSFVNVNGTTRIEPLGGSPNQSKWTTPNGVSTTVASEKGRTTSVQDPVGGISNLTYVEGMLTSYTDANGNAATYEYDTRGNVTRATDALGHAISYTYDARDNLIQRHDAGANDWFYDYDSNSNLLRIHYPNLSQAAFGYDPQGRLVSYTDGRGKRTAYSYDAYGNLRTTTFPDGGVLTYTYSGNDQYTRCWSIVDTRSKQKSYGYDANNRVTSVAYGPAPYDAQVGYAYDAQSLLAFTDELGNVTRAVRNDFDLITRLTDPLNGATAFQYDSNNKLIQQTDALGRTVRTAYDAASRPIESTDAMGQVLRRFYDATGNLTSIRDPRLKTTRFAYDGNNRLKEVRNPLDQVIAKSYDANGRVTSIVNARGNAVSFAYDAMGNTTSKSFNAVRQVAYTYDAVGNMTAANHVASGNIAYTYDANGRVQTITWPDAKTATYAYDTEGNLTGLTYPDGLVVSSQYDNFSRRKLPSGLRHGPVDDLSPQRERANQATRMSWTGTSIDFQYDKAANLVLATRSNGTNTSYTFNARRKLTRIDHRKAAVSFLNLTYSYDAAGLIVSATNSSTLAPPLQTSTSSAIYDDSNRLTSFGGTTWTSDADGNVTATGAAFAATYDAESKPLSVTVNGVVIVHVFDGADRPYRVTRNGVVSYYHWDARGRLLFITDGAGTMLNRFVYRGSRLIAQQVQSGAWYFHHFDNVGNTLALTDGSGNVVISYAYLPSGKKAQSGASPSNPFTYVGERGVLEVADGLYLMGSRLYDATVGRFLQRDPVGLTGGLNLFAYADNNPVGLIDPEGTEGEDASDADDAKDAQNSNAPGLMDALDGNTVGPGLVKDLSSPIEKAIKVGVKSQIDFDKGDYEKWDAAQKKATKELQGEVIKTGFAAGVGTFAGLLTSAAMGAGYGLAATLAVPTLVGIGAGYAAKCAYDYVTGPSKKSP